ncbi:MAG: hypothetical protein LBV41_11325 [Cytophagaceae bacterium]|jgi:tetratricopeptide (TPR) repeat protein|nr:hypothetical protein [Cytophagaceae bacterium]
MIKFLYFTFFTVILQLPVLLNAQNGTQADALKLFKESNYSGAAKIYSSLLARNNRDVNNNYYYGVCLYHLGNNRSEAIQRLKFAQSRPVSPDLFYYLGKLYQQSYEMELAIEQFERFLKQNKTESPKVADAQKAMDECAASIKLINKYFDIQIINKDTIAHKRLLEYIHLSKDAGTLMYSEEFFVTGVDEEQVVFKTERGNEVLFPMMEDAGNWNLYRIVKLLDAWNEPELLGAPIKSEGNDRYPFLLIDGVTLYFASDRAGGMGGLDIYQSYYDPESGAFTEPSNLGMPFNSPYDDFLLVPDVYAGKAWFATNREINGDSIVVCEIMWNDAVIKNNTENISQLQELARLPLSAKAGSSSSTSVKKRNGEKEAKTKGEIYFAVNDTLAYTFFAEFQSNDALAAFRKGHAIAQKRDSLNSTLNAKRKAYAQTYNQSELAKLVDQIIVIEKQTYGYEDEMNRHYLVARRLESEKVAGLVRQGSYRPKAGTTPTKIKREEKRRIDFDQQKFSFYTDEDFEMKTMRLNEMYRHFFAADQTARLQYADSLYFWANILNLESARMLEQTQGRAVSPNTAGLETAGMNSSELISLSREMRQQSLNCYEQSLDGKYGIYFPVAKEFSSSSSFTGSEEMLNQISSNYRKAEEAKREMILYNPETLERLLALKKLSVDQLEESFMVQMAGTTVSGNVKNDETSRFADSPKGYVAPSYTDIHRNRGVAAGDHKQPAPTEKQTTKENLLPADVVASAIGKKPKVEYKIQIGIFRNEPNPQMIAKVPAVTREVMPDSGLTKYFSGSWNKYVDAQNSVQAVRDAGFAGAFVVAFVNGTQVSLEKAKAEE